jgi:superfamily II DNA or RNA helicase
MYGPSLIFAINVRHAALLTDDLRNHGIRADYVASYRPDGSDGEPTAVIQQFREGHLDVLVNI